MRKRERQARNITYYALRITEKIAMPADDPIATLLHDGPRVLNVGVRSFADTLQTVGAPHLHVEWQPPAQGDPALGRLLAELADDTAPGSVGARIVAANAEAVRRILAADPVWEDVRPARAIWP